MRESVTIARFTSWPGVHHRSAVLDLVSELQHGEPYHYRPGEVPPAEDWFPALVDRSDITLMAYGLPGHPVGYCVALALARYPDALALADELGVHPAETCYLAELGVCPTMRRRGIASLLLGQMLADPPTGTTAWVIRTLETNAAAIALYQRHGLELVPDVAQTLHGRPRVYLVRRDAAHGGPRPGSGAPSSRP